MTGEASTQVTERVRHLVERAARRIHASRARRIAGVVSWRADRHGRHLRQQLDGCRQRMAELELAVLDRSACAHERLSAVERDIATARQQVDRAVALLEQLMRVS